MKKGTFGQVFDDKETTNEGGHPADPDWISRTTYTEKKMTSRWASQHAQIGLQLKRRKQTPPPFSLYLLK